MPLCDGGGACCDYSGPVWGAGSGTSDSIKALLSNGEFVITDDQVKKFGNGDHEAGVAVIEWMRHIV